MKRKARIMMTVLLFGVLSFIPFAGNAIWLTNVADQVVQTDGTIIDIYQSGDEYHNWIHDNKQYTIIQDKKTGDWCWALSTKDGNVISSGYPIHLHTPESLNIDPNQNISEQRYLEKRRWRDEILASSPSRTPSLGIVQNVVIYVRFSDQTEFSRTVDYYNDMLNAEGDGINSQYQYYWDASYNQFQVISTMYPIPPGTMIISYQSSHPRSYCRPFNSVSNPGGYQSETEGMQRLHEILGAAIEYVASQVPPSLVIDADNDGRIDNICFILRGQTDGWSDILWPHRWVLQYTTKFINGKRAWDYNLNIENDLASSGNGTLAHEFGHSLGMPDLYRYSGNYNPIGRWDLMASADSQPIGLSAYMKARYTDWVPPLEIISEPGTYTLSPVTQSRENHAYRINSPYSTHQFFVIEYRRSVPGQTDSNLFGSGILVYRVNSTTQNGNMDPPDMLYVYRPNGTTSSNGNIANAHFNQAVGRTSINDNTNPSSFLENGAAGGLSIGNISAIGNTMSFDILSPDFPSPTNLTGSFNDSSVTISWNAPPNAAGIVGYHIYRNNILLQQEPIATTTFTDIYYYPGQTYTYGVTSKYPQGESTPINAQINTGNQTTITSFPWIENFDGSIFPPTGWGIYDYDGDTEAWFKYTDQNQAHSGSSFAASASRVAGINYLPDNWLITPRIQVPANMQLSYYIGSTTSFNIGEHVSILISRTGVALSNFFVVRSDLLTTNEWRLKGIDLGPYAGENIYIAFRHHNVTGRSILKIDDVRIGNYITSEYDIENAEKQTGLIGNYPNPFNPDTIINFYLNQSELVSIAIYNIKGQLLINLLTEKLEQGYHTTTWNGKDVNGNDVGSGIYFYQMKTNTYSNMKKMILLK